MPLAEAETVRPASVVCVLLNWNGWRDTVPCIQTLLTQDAPLTIIVVDNASTDDSVQRIHAAFPQIEVLQAGANHGFAAGCNVGIRHALGARADFVWLLNNDTLAPPDTLAKLVSAAQDTHIGITGTVLRFLHDPASVQAWGGGTVSRRSGFSSHFLQPHALTPNSFLTFASVLIRREVFESIGLLDENYFMYFEDADFCVRTRDAGWHMKVAADTAVLHKEGGSAPARSPQQARIVTASGMRFLHKHGHPAAVAPWLYWLTRIGSRLLRLDFRGVHAVMLGRRDWQQGPPRAFQQERP
jgi:GT2 family glycosyltransferase